MKRLLLALICVACTGTAWAQNPTILPPAQPGVVLLSSSPLGQPQPIQQVSGGILGNRGCDSCSTGCPTTCATKCAPACATKCAPACPTKCARPAPCPECMTVPAKKVEVKVCYSSLCTKVCFKGCGSLLGGCNSGCDKGNCENRAYTQKYLIKRVHTTECDTSACVAVNPNCDTCRHSCHSGTCQAAPATVIETIPAKPLPGGKK